MNQMSQHSKFLVKILQETRRMIIGVTSAIGIIIPEKHVGE